MFKLKYFEEVMHPRKYFTLNFFINEIFCQKISELRYNVYDVTVK